MMKEHLFPSLLALGYSTLPCPVAFGLGHVTTLLNERLMDVSGAETSGFSVQRGFVLLLFARRTRG